MNRASLSSALLPLLLAACGGNVVIDQASTGAGGSGGAGTGGGAASGAGGPGLGIVPLVCSGGLCDLGDTGFAFAYSDSENMPPLLPGMSTATLATDGSLCISGYVMQLPNQPTFTDYSDDWGCGIGVNLDQPFGGNPSAYQLTGTGVTVDVMNLPACTTARVILDQNGATPNYCATLTPGVEIPWSAFNTACWQPPVGMPLSGPPDSQAIKIQFVTTTAEACPFTDFCITGVTL